MDQQEPVGSLGEEAAKLFDALRTWSAERHGGSSWGQATNASEDDAATPGSHQSPCGECRVCPICRGIALFRAVSPEVKHHLASAATAFVQNLAEAMETSVPEEYSARRSGAADRWRQGSDEGSRPSDG